MMKTIKYFMNYIKNEDVDFLITGNKKDTFDQDGPLPLLLRKYLFKRYFQFGEYPHRHNARIVKNVR